MIAYRVYVDYAPRWSVRVMLLDTISGFNEGMISGTLSLEINEPGSFEFSLISSHPHISDILLYKSTISIEMMYVDNSNGDPYNIVDRYYPFVGRVVSTDTDIYGNVSYTCEGALAFLNDSYMSNFDSEYYSIETFLTACIEDHNAMVSIPGSDALQGRPFSYCPSFDASSTTMYRAKDLSDGNDKNYAQYVKTKDAIMSNVIDIYGGFIYCVSSPIYYYADSSLISYWNTKIKYYSDRNPVFSYDAVDSDGMPIIDEYISPIDDNYDERLPLFSIETNIKDLSSSPIKTGLWTGIMPLGKDGLKIVHFETDRADRSDVLYIDNLEEKYGRIVKAVEFSNIDSKDTLLDYGREYITIYGPQNSADLFSKNNYRVNAIEPCLTSSFNKLVRLGYPVILEKEAKQIDEPNIKHFYEFTTAFSIKHNLFDANDSEYGLGMIIPKNIINEDMTRWTSRQ